MIALVTFLTVLILSLIVVRVATVALTLTGMAKQTARFQARSALTGAGFTTSESERVVNHPVRRRIIMWLMLVGNTGLVLAASLVILFLAGGSREPATARWEQFALLLGGLVALYLLAQSRWVERRMADAIERVLSRYTDVGRRDYASLLHLAGEYRVVELKVKEGSWLAGRELSELELNREGVLVLGITRDDGSYLGAPRGESRIEAGDTIMLYGREQTLTDLDERRQGVGGALRHAETVAAESAEAEGEQAKED